MTDPEKDGWISVGDKLPVTEPGIESPPVFVAVREFGYPWRLCIARCWISSEQPLFPKWYLDRSFYHLDALWQIAEQVLFWQPLPGIPEACDGLI